MRFRRWFKSPDVLVLRKRDGPGLMLVHQVTKEVQSLDAQLTAFWKTWEDYLAVEDTQSCAVQSLISGGFISTTDEPSSLANTYSFDSLVPSIAGGHVKWYSESPDLAILFNTQSMPSNNPLLALGPYGSLCWQGVIEGWTIGRIREEVLRVFGCDEVLPFLKRLSSLGFIGEIPELNWIHFSGEQITKEFSAPEIQFQLAHAAIPWYCLWEICTICDLRCKTCYLPNFNSSGPDLKHVSRVIQQIIDTCLFFVSIMGGEPLLRSDLEQIVERMRVAGLFVKVISNGQKLTLDRARSLASAGLNQIEISFDGLSSKTHESSRGWGTYPLAIQAIRNAQQAGIPRVGIVWTIHTGNFNELTVLPNFMCELDVKECYISLFKKTGMYGALAPFGPISATAVQTIHRYIWTWKEAFSELTIVLLSGCSCGRTSVVIGDTGDVRLCPFSYHSAGNVYRTPLIEIWRSIEAELPESGPIGYCTNGTVSQIGPAPARE